MLSLITVNSIQDKLELFRGRDPLRTQWVVSDLKSRVYLETETLAAHQFVQSDRILRARDLWTQLTERYFPDYRIVQDCLMEMRLRHFLDDQFLKMDRGNADVSWARRPQAHKTLLKYISYLMPILNSPQAMPAVREWFLSDENRIARWGHWFTAAAEAWVILDAEKLLTASWLSGFLAPRLASDSSYKMIADVDATYFDFGADLLPGECDLILTLSQFHDVRVIVPNSAWQSRDRNLFKSYQRIESAAKVRTSAKDFAIESDASVIPNPSMAEPRYLRFSSMLAEVKDAVAEVRKWLDSGVPAKKLEFWRPTLAFTGRYWSPICDGKVLRSIAM